MWTLCWRGMDSNFQYAGAVNLIVASLFSPRAFHRVCTAGGLDIGRRAVQSLVVRTQADRLILHVATACTEDVTDDRCRRSGYARRAVTASFGTRQDGAPPLRNRKFALLWREIDSNHRFLATASLIVSACRLVCLRGQRSGWKARFIGLRSRLPANTIQGTLAPKRSGRRLRPPRIDDTVYGELGLLRLERLPLAAASCALR